VDFRRQPEILAAEAQIMIDGVPLSIVVRRFVSQDGAPPVLDKIE